MEQAGGKPHRRGTRHFVTYGRSTDFNDCFRPVRPKRGIRRPLVHLCWGGAISDASAKRDQTVGDFLAARAWNSGASSECSFAIST